MFAQEEVLRIWYKRPSVVNPFCKTNLLRISLSPVAASFWLDFPGQIVLVVVRVA